jgi:AraC-like DNA-binding protein
MQPFVRPVFVMLGDSRIEERVRLALKPPLALFQVSDWADLREALVRASPTAICVLEPFGLEGRGGGLCEELRDILREFPLVTIVAALEVAADDALVLNALYSWGVADVLDIARESSPAAVARRLGEVRGRWAQQLLARALPRTVPSRARAMLAVVSDVASDGGQARELAAALGIGERTIARWCGRVGLPHARRLFAWIRLLLVAELLGQTNRSVASIARACGYSGGASLNFTLRSFLDMNASELRAKDAFETVAETFRQELREHRELSRRQGQSDKRGLN